METKFVSPKVFFYSEGKTTLSKINDYADKAAPELLAEMEKSGIEATGPMEFIYFGVSKAPNKVFTLRIAVPVVKEKTCSKGFYFQTASAFKCVDQVYKGDINKISSAYDQIFQRIFKNNLQPNDEVREVYLHYEDLTSEKNITEIQIGVN